MCSVRNSDVVSLSFFFLHLSTYIYFVFTADVKGSDKVHHNQVEFIFSGVRHLSKISFCGTNRKDGKYYYYPPSKILPALSSKIGRRVLTLVRYPEFFDNQDITDIFLVKISKVFSLTLSEYPTYFLVCVIFPKQVFVGTEILLLSSLKKYCLL